MSKLENSLKEWVALGIISPDHATRIREHEANKPESSWILSGLLILGAIVVGIGVISLIAANWYQIPDSVKLAGDFLLLIALAFATLYSWDSKRAIQFEVLLLLFLLLCLASIGLISQIYNTGGKLYQALLLWSLITFAVAMAARQKAVPFIWTGAFLVGIVFTALDSVALRPIFQQNYPAVFMAVPLLCAVLTFASKRLVGEIGSTRAFRDWTLIGGLVALLVVELQHQFPPGQVTHGLIAYYPGYVLAVFAALGIWQNAEYKPIQKILLWATLALFLIPFHFSLFGVKASIAYAIFTILIVGFMTVFLASIKETRLFQWFLFLLGVRFLFLYFQALGGLATTGVGLIISGGLVIAMAVLWNKYRTSLAVWTERWVQ
jgi:uncharacterized membrane protein